MAYGRLEVVWPNGKFNSFPLVNSTESVGRSQGNSIRIDAETISRYHFSVLHKDNTVILTDMGSQNGTYVDGVKLNDGDSVTLRGGEEIIIGELHIVYYEMEELETQPVAPTDLTTVIIKQHDSPFQISIVPPPIGVPPGAHASAELSVVNLSDDKGFYNIEVTGIPRNWVRIDRPRLVLDAHESAQIVINVRPARKPDTAPGLYTVNVAVREENHGDIVLQASAQVMILAYSGFGMALERDVVNDTDRFRLHLHNHGSAPLPITLGESKHTPNVELELLTAKQVVLEPGQQLLIQGHAKAKKRSIIGKPTLTPFDIVARSGDKSQFMAVVRGKVLTQPILPTFAAITLGLAFLIFIVLAGLTLNLLTAPDPQIVAFDVAETTIERGQPLDITWETTDVSSLMLLVDGVAYDAPTLDPDVGTLTLDTSTFADPTTLQLSGTQRGRDVSDSQTVRVYDPVRMVAFDAVPDSLVAYVISTLDITWDVENAEAVQLLGLEDADTNQALDTSYGAQDGAYGVSVLVEGGISELTLRLNTQNALGTPVALDTLTIPVTPAQCTALDDVELHQGPDMLHQVVSSVDAGDTLLITGRYNDVQSGQWLRIQLEAIGPVWGPSSAFDCGAAFAIGDLLAVQDVPPVPTLTPTPTATATPVASPTRPPLPTFTPITPAAEAATPTRERNNTQQRGPMMPPTATAAG